MRVALLRGIRGVILVVLGIMKSGSCVLSVMMGVMAVQEQGI